MGGASRDSLLARATPPRDEGEGEAGGVVVGEDSMGGEEKGEMSPSSETPDAFSSFSVSTKTSFLVFCCCCCCCCC